MRHEHNQRHLPHVGALAGHVRAGDDEHAHILAVHRRIVGHERIALQHLLDDRMTAVDDLDRAVLGDFRTHVAVFVRHLRKRQKRVERLERLRRLLHTWNRFSQRLLQFGKQLRFQPDRPFRCAEDLLFHFLQFRRSIALAVGQRLTAHIAKRHEIVVRFRNLDAVAENLVVGNLQRFNARLLAFALLHGGNPFLAVFRSRAQIVQLLAVAGQNEPAVAHQARRVRVNHFCNAFAHIVERVEFFAQRAERLAFAAAEQRLDFRHARKRVSQRQTVLRIERIICNFAYDTLHIAHLAQRFAQIMHAHGRRKQFLYT